MNISETVVIGEDSKNLEHSHEEKAVNLLVDCIATDHHGHVTDWQESFLLTDTFRTYDLKNRGIKFLKTTMVTPVDHRLLPISARGITETILLEDRTGIIQLLKKFDENIEGFEILAPDGKTPVPYIRHRLKSYLPLSVYG